MSAWLALLGLTAFHLTWTAALLTGAVALLLRAGWPRRPAQRVRLAQCALVATLALGGILGSAIARGTLASTATILVSPEHAAGGAPMLDAIGRTAPWLGAFVLLIAAVALLRLLIGWYRVTGLLRRTSAAPTSWVRAMERARAWRDGAPRVRLVAGPVATPMLLGTFRYTLVVPCSDEDGLDADDRMLIVAHEIAHAQRRDGISLHLVALLRAVLAAVPSVHWLARVVDHEREAACDTLVIAGGVAATDYARALLHLVAPLPDQHRLALPSNGGSLVTRIERLLAARPAAPVRLRVSGAAMVLMLLPAVLLPGWIPATRDALAAAVVPDVMAIQAADPAGEFRVEFRRGRPVAASADGVPLPPPLIVAGDSLQLRTAAGAPVVTVRLHRHQLAWLPRLAPQTAVPIIN